MNRYRYRGQWRFASDFLHPVRVCGELFARLVDAARRAQVSAANYSTLPAFWRRCFTCDEYPRGDNRGADSAPLWNRKGRFHSCAAGCARRPRVEPPGQWGGAVAPRRRGVCPPGELFHEGFWNAGTVRDLFALYARVNGSADWPPPGEGREHCGRLAF